MHDRDPTMQTAALAGWVTGILNVLPVSLTLIAVTFSIIYYGLKIYGDPTTQKIIAWLRSTPAAKPPDRPGA